MSGKDAIDDRTFRATAVRVVLACAAVALVIGLYGAARDPLDIAQWCIDSVIGAAIGLAVALLWWVPPELVPRKAMGR